MSCSCGAHESGMTSRNGVDASSSHTQAGGDDALTLPQVAAQLAHQDIRAADVHGKRVLLRVDFNVPHHGDDVADFSRVDAALPTIELLLNKDAKVLLVSHLGRPKPAKSSMTELRNKFSLRIVCEHLQTQLGSAFRGFVNDCVGPDVTDAVSTLQSGQALLLENTRFHAGEEACDPDFAQALAAQADVFVNDAFGTCHRDQASVTGVARLCKERFPGLLVTREVKYLLDKLENPVRPFAVVIGGSKVRDKIQVLWEMINKADKIVVGGRMAFTFLAAQGVAVGATQVEHDWLQAATEMLAAAKAKGVLFLLPEDVTCTYDLDSLEPCCTKPLTVSCCSPSDPCIPADAYGADIGPKSAVSFVHSLQDCRTVFWNGPMGRFEVAAYAKGTEAVARGIAALHGDGIVTVVGGGDSVTAVRQLHLESQFSHLSTGGGASLELIEGKGMPGLRALASA